jgi:hypothetical protein
MSHFWEFIGHPFPRLAPVSTLFLLLYPYLFDSRSLSVYVSDMADPERGTSLSASQGSSSTQSTSPANAPSWMLAIRQSLTLPPFFHTSYIADWIICIVIIALSELSTLLAHDGID